jgi:pilus assembly protein TadC
MIVLLIAGIACLAVAAFQITRPSRDAEYGRRAALASVRSLTGGEAETPETPRRSLLLAPVSALLVRVHLALWRNSSPDDITTELRRAGMRRTSAESFMAARVGLTAGAIVAGFALGDGPRGLVLGCVFAAAAVFLPGFLLKKAATRRADKVDAELPQFVDQLAIAIEAGMSFDAAVTYLVEASEGPLAEELGRVMTELRVGESRHTALKRFAERVGNENALAFANAVLASDQLGAPLAGILRSQAADLRHRRQMHAEERAQKAPVKMLLPIAIFILPVMLVVILAPAFLGGGPAGLF